MWGLSGKLNVSQKYHSDTTNAFGTSYSLDAGKISGNFRFSYSHLTQTDTYDINDMGFNSRNNRFDNDIEFEYNIYDPVGIILNMQNELQFSYDMLYAPRDFVFFDVEYSNRTTFRNFFTAGLNIDIKPVESNDFYEPRVDGWKLIRAETYYGSFFLSPDYRKRFVLDFSAGYWLASEYNGSGYNLRLKPRIRINDRFSITLESEYDNDDNTIGYVTDSIGNAGEEVIIMGKRNVSNIENVLDAEYIFAKNISLSIRARHYWIKVNYNDFYNLRKDGYLDPGTYTGDHDFTSTAFNIDMIFRWIFAPASELIFVWKNNIYTEKSDNLDNYFNDLRFTFKSPMTNSFSVKVLYYLDYQSLKKKNRKPPPTSG